MNASDIKIKADSSIPAHEVRAIDAAENEVAEL